MDSRTLGSTNLTVSRLGMGGLFIISRFSGFDQAQQAVHRAVDLGVTYADTAPSYGNSELVLGRILDDIDTPLILSTKLGGGPHPFNPQSREALEQSVDMSLRLLGRDHIDIFFIHEPERPGQYDWWTDPENFDGPALELLQDLNKDGTISAIGIGGTTAYEMADLIRTGKFDVVLTALNYSLLWREAETEVLPQGLFCFSISQYPSTGAEPTDGKGSIDFAEVELGFLVVVVVQVAHIPGERASFAAEPRVNVVLVGVNVGRCVINVRNPGARVKT